MHNLAQCWCKEPEKILLCFYASVYDIYLCKQGHEPPDKLTYSLKALEIKSGQLCIHDESKQDVALVLFFVYPRI